MKKLSLVLLFIVLSASAQVEIVREGGVGFHCVDASNQIVSSHAQQYKAIQSCQNALLNDADGEYSVISTGRLRLSFSAALAQAYPGVNNSLPAGQEVPPNDPPVWNNTPDPRFIESIAGSESYSQWVSDPEGDALTFVNETGCTLPTGVTIDNTNKEIDASTSTVAGTTTSCVHSADDGTNSKVNSPAFSIVITSGDPDFPRLGIYQIGNWGTGLVNLPGGLAGRAERIAKHDIAIIDVWKQWEYNNEVTKDASDIAIYIKSFNANIVLYRYADVIEMNVGSSQLDQWVKARNKLDTESNGPGDWWLRDAAGNKTSSFSGLDRTNHSDLVDVDSHGWTYAEWYANLFYWDRGDNPGEDYDALGFGHKKVYGWSGIYFDVTDWDGRVNADWDEDNDDEPKHEAEAVLAMTTGHVDAVNAWDGLESTFLWAGNYSINSRTGEIASVPARMFDLVNGPLLERSLREETCCGTNNFLARYKNLMSFSTGLATRHEFVDTNDAQLPGTHSLSDWMRYGLGLVSLDNGYFGMRSEPGNDALIINEYDIDLGQALAEPDYSGTDPSGYTRWDLNSFMREYENGMHIVNPKDNGTRVYTLPSPGGGCQWDNYGASDFSDPVDDPDVNDGDLNITTQSLPERHAIFIKRSC